MNALAVFVFAMPALLAAHGATGASASSLAADALSPPMPASATVRLNAPPEAPTPERLPSASCSRRSTWPRNGTPRERDRVFADDDGAERHGRRRGRQAGAAADPLAGDLGAVPVHRAARRAGRDRRDAAPTARCWSPARCARRAAAGDDSALLQLGRRHRRRAARSSTRSTRSISCRSASICPSPTCSAALGIEQIGRRADEFRRRQPARMPIALPGGIGRCPSSATRSSFPTWWPLTPRKPILL